MSISDQTDRPAAAARGANITRARKGATPDIRDLLEPVQYGLHLVESKMKTVELSLFAPLAHAFMDLIESGGKRIRPAIALMVAELSGPMASMPDYDKVLALAAAVEMLHTATLVHDDVIDGALLRRGAPTLNANWDAGATVMAGNYMFGQAAYLSAATKNMRVIRLFSHTLQTIVNGELRQLNARYQFRQERDMYYQRIYAKTASLFATATESTAILSGLSEAEVDHLRSYGRNLGMAFQIVDDILDFTGDAPSLGKPVGSDLGQGTLTLPFFYFLQQHPDPDGLIQRLDGQRPQGHDADPAIWEATVQRTVAEVCHTGAVDDAYREAEEFAAKAQRDLHTLPATVFKDSLLSLCDFVVVRRS